MTDEAKRVPKTLQGKIIITGILNNLAKIVTTGPEIIGLSASINLGRCFKQ